jgi:hypothetical protein
MLGTKAEARAMHWCAPGFDRPIAVHATDDFSSKAAGMT